MAAGLLGDAKPTHCVSVHDKVVYRGSRTCLCVCLCASAREGASVDKYASMRP